MTKKPDVPAQLPQAWTAAVVASDGTRVGLGVLVEPRHLVTCAHVVCRALELSEGHATSPEGTVAVEIFRSRQKTTGRIVCWHAVDGSFTQRFQDICVLELDDASSVLASWDDLLAQEPRVGNAVRVFGYPHRPPGRLSTGNVLVGEIDGGWWQLDPPANPHAGYTPISPGFSGSLAWDMAEDKAVGIVVAKATDSATSFLIPTALLYDACGKRLAPTAPVPPTAISGTGQAALLPFAISGVGHVTAPPGAATAPQVDLEAGPERHPPSDVFLCHSSADKPAVRELAAALKKRGLRPWLDEWELVPGRPWQEAIENAIATVRSAAVLFGPSGIGPWADREMRAFLDEFVRRRIPVIPVLLPGAPVEPELPIFLRAFTWVDLRAGIGGEALDRLVWGITSEQTQTGRVLTTNLDVLIEASAGERVSGARLFKLWNVPPLPAEHRPRPELEALKAALTSPDPRPLALAGQWAHLAVQGMGGVGKTVLAAALARDPDVRRAFPDGVYWLTLGQTPEEPIAAQARLAAALGGKETTFATVEDGRARLLELAERATLLVLDDVWQAAHAHPFNVVGERGRLLVTTRKQEVTHGLGAESRSLGELPTPEALDLLARYAGIEATALPAEAAEIARECGDLPLALAMVGAQLRGRPADRWKTALARLRGADLARLKAELPGYPHASLLAAIDVSVADLDPTLRRRYLDLAVFPKDAPVPEATLLTYWAPNGATEGDVQDTVDTFVARSLARRDGEGRLGLHDLQHDFVRARTADRGAGLHARLVAAYRAATPKGLHAGPNDGYYFQRIAAHLAAAEGRDALRSLLLDARWLAAKLGAAGTAAMLADFELLDGINADSALRLARDALRLSAHVLDQRPAKLAGQVIGRLGDLAAGEPDLGRLCADAAQLAHRPALLPLWPRLDAPGSGLLRTFEGPHGPVMAVAMSADGKTALSGAHDSTLELWDLASGKLLRTFEGHQGQIKAVAMSADGKTALSGAHDSTLKLWDLASGKLLRTFKGHQNWVMAVAIGGDGKTALSGSSDGTLKFWDLASGKLLRTFKGHQNWVMAVAIGSDGMTALSGSSDRTLKLWDLASGKLLRSFEGHQEWVMAVAIGGDGKTALSGSSDGTLKFWDLASGKLLRSFEGHQGSVNTVAMGGDGMTALSGSQDKTLKLWDLASGKLLRSFEGHQSSINTVAVSRDRKTALSGSTDTTLKLWDLASVTRQRTLEGHQAEVNATAMSRDGKAALSGSHDKTLKLWDVTSGKLLRTFNTHQGWVMAVAMSGDGKTALSGSSGTLKLWDLPSGQLLHSFEDFQRSVTAVTMSDDGKTALSGYHDHCIELWDLASGTHLRTFEGHQSSVNALAMSANGKTALSGSSDNTLELWDLASGKLLGTFKGHGHSVNALAMSANGKTALSGSSDNALELWDLASRKLLRTLKGHHNVVRAVAMSADGQIALSGSDDGTLKLWDLTSGDLMASFTADASIASAAITPDARLAVAGDSRGRVHAFEIVR